MGDKWNISTNLCSIFKIIVVNVTLRNKLMLQSINERNSRNVSGTLIPLLLDKQRDVHTKSMVNDVINFIYRRGVLDTTLCNRVCLWLTVGRWFSLNTPVSCTNKTDHHDITEILLKVALNTINPKPTQFPFTGHWQQLILIFLQNTIISYYEQLLFNTKWVIFSYIIDRISYCLIRW